MKPSQTIRFLARLVRQSERAIDHQVRALEELDDKIERMMTIAVSAIGVALALATVVFQAPTLAPGPAFEGSLLAGIVLNLAALLSLYDGYVGLLRRIEFHVGPRPDTWNRRLKDASWNEEAFLRGMLASSAEYFRFNARTETRKQAARRLGVYLLLLSILPYVLAIALIGA